MKARIIPTMLAASLSLYSGLAAAQVKDEQILTEDTLHALVENADPLVDMARLPIKGIQAVENSDGQIIYISDSGRFAFVGQLVDVWQVKTLDTMQEIKSAVAKIDLRGDGIDVESLNVVSLGEGDKEVIVFTDPQCTVCSRVMADAEKLTGKYTFRFIVIPALGDESNKLARQLYCAANPGERYDALKNNTISTLQTISDCNMDRYDQTLILAHMLSIDGVPFILSPEGRVYRGRPANLEGWLEEEAQTRSDQ